MSGPVAPADADPQTPADGPATRPAAPAVELWDGRSTEVGGLPVVRGLPRRERRTVGAWCFVDHFGPSDVAAAGMQVGPHPHTGLHTVTWVFEGVVLHRDSLGSEQLIRPGQLNLMSAGRGVAHAEETPKTASGRLHGLQLWVAQPEATRWGDADFEHHPSLPRAEVGAAMATVLVGTFAGARSPARADTSLVGVDLALAGASGTTLPLDPAFEHGLVVTEGAVHLVEDDAVVRPGRFAFLGRGREELDLAGAPGSRALLVGGVPFEEPILMAWNFVVRTKAELDEAFSDWEAESDRFGAVRSPLPRISPGRPG
jgi:quercetin 2,3-dioxygenase